jgi:sulfatase modifying factor 1
LLHPRASSATAKLLGLLLISHGVVPCVGAAEEHKPGTSFRDCADVCPEMVVIPPGSYLMGATPDDPNQNPAAEEQPQHRVTISYPLAVGKFEVTRDEYAAFVADTALTDPDSCNVHEPPRWPTIMGLNWHNTGFPQTGRHPVVCVSWLEASAFTEWLSKKTGHRYRLLSEAEWEYADRAGTISQAYWGDNQDDACLYANGIDATLTERFPKGKWETAVTCHDGYIHTAPVGSFKPNAFGLYDMEGNVFEWVEDCWIPGYKHAPNNGSARVTRPDCNERVNRGGSWTAMPTGLRSAHRGDDNYERTRVVDLGFRVARELP